MSFHCCLLSALFHLSCLVNVGAWLYGKKDDRWSSRPHINCIVHVAIIYPFLFQGNYFSAYLFCWAHKRNLFTENYGIPLPTRHTGKKWFKEATPLVLNKEKTTIEDVGMKVEQAVQMFDRRFTDTLLTHFCYYRSRLSTDGRLMIGQYSDQHLTNTRPTLRRNIDRYVDRHSTDIRPMLDRYSL